MSKPNRLSTIAALEDVYGLPKESSRRKVRPHLTASMQGWLKHSPFFVMSTVSDQSIDCSPRGDAPGRAFRIIDPQTLAIPDRQGNNRVDTLRNLINDPRIGLLFLIPGVEEAIRIKGRAHISVAHDLLESLSLNGEPALSAIVVDIVEAYVQNARAIRASHLWDAHSPIEIDSLPNAFELSN